MAKKDCCEDCEVFKNHQGELFLFGFYCPIKDTFVQRHDFSCEWIVSDNLPF